MQQVELLGVLDFAENYHCTSQDEVQVTIHPIVFSYSCSCGMIVTESRIIVSDDLSHDTAAVQTFTKAALQHMKSRGSFTRFIQFSDGCSAQYKSKQPFAYIQESSVHFGMPIERHFLEADMGKNPQMGRQPSLRVQPPVQ